MAEKLDIDTRVSAQGWVVIPALVRALLGVRGGDRVRFVVEDGVVRLVTGQSLLSQVWANNHSGDAGNSVVDVRSERIADQALVEERWERLDAQAADVSRSEAEVESPLFAELGLAP